MSKGKGKPKSHRKNILALLGISVICSFAIILFVKILEWSGLAFLTIREEKWGLTQVDILIVLIIIFPTAIFFALLLLYRNGYFGGDKW